MAAKTVAVAIDESPQSLGATTWAIDNLLDRDGQLQLVTVMSPLTYPVTPSVPIATAGAVAAIAQTWEAQKAANEEHAREVIEKAATVALERGVAKGRLQLNVLPAAGGASGVGESIVEYANVKKPDVLVLGSRGMGAAKRSLMSMLGLGSVSDYGVHHCQVPVLVYHPTQERGQPLMGVEATAPQPDTPPGGASPAREGGAQDAPGRKAKKVMVAIDDSPHSKETLAWLLQHLVRPGDELHIVSVAMSVPLPIVDETSAAVAMMETSEWREAKQESEAMSFNTCIKGVEQAIAAGLPKEQVFFKSMFPEGGASDVGESLCHYARDNAISLVVVGSRGLGALERGVATFFGLGSVSDYAVHNCPMPVLVYKK